MSGLVDRRFVRIAALLATVLAAPLSGLAAGEEYAPPGGWNGSKEGATDGNPLLVDGAPRWRFDAVVNPRQRASPIPMTAPK